MRRLITLSLVAATLSGCGTLSRNNARGLAAVGGATVIAGTVTLLDGWSCDDRYAHDAACTHDRGELATGATLTAAGAAMLVFGLWRLAHDPDDEVTPAPPAARSAAR